MSFRVCEVIDTDEGRFGFYRKVRPDDITDDMVERAASVLAIADGYNPNEEDPAYWHRTTRRYLDTAAMALVAALDEETS